MFSSSPVQVWFKFSSSFAQALFKFQVSDDHPEPVVCVCDCFKLGDVYPPRAGSVTFGVRSGIRYDSISLRFDRDRLPSISDHSLEKKKKEEKRKKKKRKKKLMLRTRSGAHFGRMNPVAPANAPDAIVGSSAGVETEPVGVNNQPPVGPEPVQVNVPQPGMNDLIQAMLSAQQQRDRTAQANEKRFLQLLGTLVPRRDTPVNNVPEPKLRALGKDDDIEAFLTTFERTMGNCRIPEQNWTAHLAPQLTGKAQLAYAALDQDAAHHYPTTKTAILRRYNIDAECYRSRFRAAKPTFSVESALDFCTRLHDLAEQWLREATDRADVVDALILEQLLSSLPPDVQVHVRQGRPSTASAAAELADAFLRARRDTKPAVLSDPMKPSSNDKVCSYCHHRGHTMDECRKRKRVSQEREHNRNAAQAQVPPQNSTVDGRTCTQPTRQGQQGRPQPSRPWRANGNAPDFSRLRCYNCNQPGHLIRDCPHATSSALATLRNPALVQQCRGGLPARVFRTGTVFGTPTSDICLDTGCSQTLVHSSLVPREKLLDETVDIRCAHGDIVSYPMAVAPICIDSEQYTVRVGVSCSLPHSVLLGTDVPGVFCHLADEDAADVLVVTRAQRLRQEREEALRLERQLESEVKAGDMDLNTEDSEAEEPEPVERSADTTNDFDSVFAFADDFFDGGSDRVRITRAERRHRNASPGRAPTTAGFTMEDIKRLQDSAASLAFARQAASNHSDSSFFYQDGLLFHRYRGADVDSVSDTDNSDIHQLVLPYACRKQVLYVAHTLPMAGHLGVSKTKQRILQRFYWPSLSGDVKEYCSSCRQCQLASNRRPPRAPMIPLPVLDEPFSRIAMDIVGPLPRSSQGNRYILVVCDYATRYPEAFALKSIDAETVADNLVRLFSRIGIPKEILTDQGSNFMSKLLSSMYERLGIHALRTSPYHPQTDGLVERFNQTLKAMLRKFVDADAGNWDTLLPYVLFAYREAPQASTGFSPNELVFGRQLRGPLDVMKEVWTDSQQPQPEAKSVIQHMLNIRDRLDRCQEVANKNLRSAQQRQKAWYDKNARTRSFKAGDNVLVLLPSSTSKLLAEWQGPYPITKQVGPVSYEVNMFDKRRKKRIFHVNMLRGWHSADNPRLVAFTVPEADTVEDDSSLGSTGDMHPSSTPQQQQRDHLTAEQNADLESLLAEFDDVFSDKPGRTTLAEHEIHTADAPPIRQAPYRIPHAYRDTVRNELHRLVADDIIEPSSSPWASPIV